MRNLTTVTAGLKSGCWQVVRAMMVHVTLAPTSTSAPPAAVQHAAAEPSPAVDRVRPPRSRAATWGRYSLGLSVAAGLLAVAVPAVSGVPWGGVVHAVVGVPPAGLAALLAVWALGLWMHTITLTAALPRLTRRRALTLSLTGSAVANVLPMGGAAGVALNYRMARSWGFGGPQLASYTVVTNVWDVLAKLLLPVVAVPLLVLSGPTALGHLLGAAEVLTVVLALVVLLVVVTVAVPDTAGRLGAGVDRVVTRLLRTIGSSRQVTVRQHLVDLQRSCTDVVRDGWGRLTLGMTLYTGSLLLLLGGCLHLTGAGLTPVNVLAGFAVERLLTLAGLTPGGAGVVEVGLAGALLTLGGDPAGVVSGVLLYRALTFGLEIPVGGIGLAVWLWAGRQARRQASVRVAA